MTHTGHRIIFWVLTPRRIVGCLRHSSVCCEPAVLLVVKTQKNIYVFISVNCLIIGFILCRINNINKADDYDVEDKNYYNDHKNKPLRLTLLFKQQTTGLNTYLCAKDGIPSADSFTNLPALSLVFFLSLSFRVAASASSTANDSHPYETLGCIVTFSPTEPDMAAKHSHCGEMWAKVLSFIFLNFTLSWHLNRSVFFFLGKYLCFLCFPLVLRHKIPVREVLAFQHCPQNATVSGNIKK